MRFFLKTVAANIVATLIMLMFLAVVMLVIVAICVRGIMGAHVSSTAVADKSVLVFDMNMAIPDSPAHASNSVSFGLGGVSASGPSVALYNLVEAINQAAKDDHITAMFLSGSLNTDNSASGYATLHEVRQAIENFKATGKKVYAYLEEPTLRDYYLASAADEVTMNPYGFLTINGLSAQTMYIHGALEKYGVGVQVTRVGKYKSYTEMFTEDHMSDADREQLTGLLHDIWGTLSTDIAAGRKLDVAAFDKLSSDPGLYLAQDALKDKLVDKLAYLDQEIDELEKVGAYDASRNTFRQVSLVSYAQKLADERDAAANSPFASDNHIAVVYAEGEIVDGQSGDQTVGGDELAETLRTLRENPDVKAVVLRVNSPGGSAMASELIQREMRDLLDAKIPVVVSMGTYAASGGYWISAYSDYIYAEPTTVTGSIGVFGLKLNFQDIANQHGLTFDSVNTVPNADMDSIVRPWTPDEQQLAQKMVDYLYDQFITKVAQGRKLNPDAVREIAQGRVWSGTAALEKDKGLVNALGGLQDAIAKAVDLAGLKGKPYVLMQYPEVHPQLEELVQELASNGAPAPVSKLSPALQHDPVSAALKQLGAQWQLLRSFNDPRGMYARLPYMLQF